MRAHHRLAPAVLGLAVLAACDRAPGHGRVIVLGLDGMDPHTVDTLMAEGRMPNLARLRAEGAHGRLLSSRPLLSPILWTTIATGKPPDQHHIGHFVAVNEQTGEQLPVTSQMRKVQALWNILSDAGRTVDVVGWWATWPAERINGAVVSDHTCYHFLLEDGATGSPDATGLVSPPALEPTLRPMIRRPADLTPADIAPFVHVGAAELDRPFRFDDDLSHFKWALATAESYRAIAGHLWKHAHPDALFLYIEATDSVAHLFGHLHRVGGLAGELAVQQQRYGQAVEQMYLYADRLVGEWLGLIDDRTTLIVLSDHGFDLGALPDDPSRTRDMRRVSEEHHRPDGILYLYGRGVRARGRFDRPTLVDIAPTVLALAGVAPARDMPGRVLAEGLTIGDPPRAVASYERGDAAAAASGAGDRAVDAAVLERLRALGYLDAQSPKGDRNLAAVLFQEGRFVEAEQAYAALVRENPDDAALRASWAGALGALGRYDESLAQIETSIASQPLAPEAYHNRGVIREKQGRLDAAVADYRQALRYNPRYAPSRQALKRLTGSARVAAAHDPSEQRATALAEEASQAARRGDYQAAMRTLDEAERIAPHLALVHQYRANVAFLMGDRERARAALEQALQIEPDNALFRTNLQRLAEGGSAPQPK